METFDSIELLRESRLRPTLARIAILELFQGPRSYTPDQIYRALVNQAEDISLATMYRALAQLLEAGILSRQQLDHGPGRYFLARGHASQHMLCTVCGTLVSVPGPELTSALKHVAAKQGYLLGEYTLAMQGICNACVCKKADPAKARLVRPKRMPLRIVRVVAK